MLIVYWQLLYILHSSHYFGPCPVLCRDPLSGRPLSESEGWCDKGNSMSQVLILPSVSTCIILYSVLTLWLYTHYTLLYTDLPHALYSQVVTKGDNYWCQGHSVRWGKRLLATAGMSKLQCAKHACNASLIGLCSPSDIRILVGPADINITRSDEIKG